MTRYRAFQLFAFSAHFLSIPALGCAGIILAIWGPGEPLINISMSDWVTFSVIATALLMLGDRFGGRPLTKIRLAAYEVMDEVLIKIYGRK